MCEVWVEEDVQEYRMSQNHDYFVMYSPKCQNKSSISFEGLAEEPLILLNISIAILYTT